MSLVGGAPPNPGAIARALLASVKQWYTAHADDAGNPAQALPARQFVAPGAPRSVPWEDSAGQVTVALDRLLYGLDHTAPPRAALSPRQEPANVGRLNRLARFEVQIVRCQPSLTYSGRVQTADVIDAQGFQLMSDAGHLSRAINAAVTSGDLLRLPARATVVVGDVETLGPDGDLAAIAIPVTVPIL